MSFRTRIAPSPTGPDCHIGNLKTCLINYIVAKQHKGSSFIFRIEDTDQSRSKPEYADAIANSFNWVGLKADEGYKIGGDFGPYSQMEKLQRYKQVSDMLIEKGYAYRCYCTEEELNNKKLEFEKNNKKVKFKYPGICRDRKDYPKNKDYVVRFKAPTEGNIFVNDKVFGNLIFPNKENYDFVIIRSSGVPLYNFGCVVDDIDQQINFVIRGRDHLINLTPQILLYNALNASIPEFAHLPMMLGQDGSKLSKRHGSVSITEFKEKGYSPSAIINYLARFGWANGNQEIFSIEDLIEKFDINKCGKSDGKFDIKKLDAIQQVHMKNQKLISDNRYSELVQPFLLRKGFKNFDYIKKIIPVIRDRAKNFIQASDEIDLFLNDNVFIAKDLEEKAFTNVNKLNVKESISVLKQVNNWEPSSIKENLNNWLQKNNLTMKDIAQPLRILLTGRQNSPDLFQVMGVLGKEKSIKRLDNYVF